MNKNLTEEYKDFILLHGDNLEQINQINHKVDMIFANPPYFYNPQIEMFARFKMKSSFHKTKRII